MLFVDVPEVELGSRGDECSFDAIKWKNELGEKDNSLLELSKMVRGADTQNRNQTPQSEDLVSMATRICHNPSGDHDNMNKQFHMHNALHNFRKLQRQEDSQFSIHMD